MGAMNFDLAPAVYELRLKSGEGCHAIGVGGGWTANSSSRVCRTDKRRLYDDVTPSHRNATSRFAKPSHAAVA